MATKITPSHEYLNQFSSPLWDLIDLESCTPLTIVEGIREELPFVVIDMQHRAYGLLSDENRITAISISTFFIVKHLQKIKNPTISQYPNEYQVSVDRHFVYLVLPSKQIRPGKWEDMLARTIKIATTLNEQVAQTPKQEKPQKTYTPVGGGIFFQSLGLIASLVLGVSFLILGIAGLTGLMKLTESNSESVTLGLKLLFVSPIGFLGAYLQYIKVKKRL